MNSHTISDADRKKQAGKIRRVLAKAYPDADCALIFSSPYELLVATILSAQCTDERVNKVTPALFKAYPAPKDLANASLDDIISYIRSTGFYNNKAKSIQNAARMICENFDGAVPDTMEDLLKLPGVARKTANVVLGTAFHKNEGVVVDTHVKRLSNRMGLSTHSNPDKIEKDLMQSIPQKEWTDFAHRITAHGRTVCTARKPDCSSCGMKSFCPSAGSFT